MMLSNFIIAQTFSEAKKLESKGQLPRNIMILSHLIRSDELGLVPSVENLGNHPLQKKWGSQFQTFSYLMSCNLSFSSQSKNRHELFLKSCSVQKFSRQQDVAFFFHGQKCASKRHVFLSIPILRR